MPLEKVDEPVAVGAVFRGRQVHPRWFIRGQVRHSISAVNMAWRGRDGDSPLRYYSVTADGATYQLRLDQASMEWRLVGVEIE